MHKSLLVKAGDEAHKWTKLIEAERASIRALKEQLCELEEQLVKKDKVIVELESFGLVGFFLPYGIII